MADFIEGKRPVIEALRTEVPCKRVLLADNVKRDPLIEDVLRKAKKRNVPVETVPRARLEKLSERGSHQGVMAETKPFNYVNVTTIVETANAQAAENGEHNKRCGRAVRPSLAPPSRLGLPASSSPTSARRT